ncbi:hypothetical protein H8K52_01480 [Undibacterium seohonense]|jgi:hypothetical protein|uniref:Uncharacterized protein n=1 Tax=Undibacterium seohonense TaxID=1344950 RepID=A0ABR6WZA4_9BURK|nr:hypothetical protein [Undibacterium seohonense]MBC3806013.1 hypothetical protein [Undibacterium seohonense]
MTEATIQQAELRVLSGETYRIPDGTVLILVDNLIVEDNAKIEVAPGAELLTIKSKATIFGKNTFISAKGSDGSDGEAGGNGTALHLFIGNVTFNGNTIDTRGGKGGNGTKGAKGRRGRDAECSGADATNGGQGGKGNPGGTGGRGGDISISYTSAGPLKLLLRPEGGQGGAPGAGGDGGDGGGGKTRCGVWSYWSRGSGYGGAAGAQGELGLDGLWGDYVIQQVSATESDKALSEVIEKFFPKDKVFNINS